MAYAVASAGKRSVWGVNTECRRRHTENLGTLGGEFSVYDDFIKAPHSLYKGPR